MAMSSNEAFTDVLECMAQLGLVRRDMVVRAKPEVKAELAKAALRLLVAQGGLLAEMVHSAADMCNADDGDPLLPEAWRDYAERIWSMGPLGSTIRSFAIDVDVALQRDSVEPPPQLH